MFNIIPGLQKAVAIATPKKHIFFLSHMRSYTSLFGHIMGSNPHICGYYEMHIGYYSWKSLIRQKLLYFDQEPAKPGFKFMFDKILHDDHYTSLNVLNRNDAKSIFCLRHPNDVIPSILKLYKSMDPDHPFNSESFATQYYVQRLTSLEQIANQLEQEFFYLDAESIKLDSLQCLHSLSEWLCLATPLSPKYDIQKNTSRERFGDTSGKLNVGHIATDTNNYAHFKHDPKLQELATRAYDRVRQRLIELSTYRCITRSNDQ
ncbi:MAG: hypothetical protein R3E64_07045 [Halioglobus sp.]